jgi:hypothetical protein
LAEFFCNFIHAVFLITFLFFRFWGFFFWSRDGDRSFLWDSGFAVRVFGLLFNFSIIFFQKLKFLNYFLKGLCLGKISKKLAYFKNHTNVFEKCRKHRRKKVHVLDEFRNHLEKSGFVSQLFRKLSKSQQILPPKNFTPSLPTILAKLIRMWKICS